MSMTHLSQWPHRLRCGQGLSLAVGSLALHFFCFDADMSHLMFWAPGDGLSTAFHQISIPVRDMSSLSYDQATAPLTRDWWTDHEFPDDRIGQCVVSTHALSGDDRGVHEISPCWNLSQNCQGRYVLFNANFYQQWNHRRRRLSSWLAIRYLVNDSVYATALAQ